MPQSAWAMGAARLPSVLGCALLLAAAAAAGAAAAAECECEMKAAPVCGQNQLVYINECVARCQGIPLAPNAASCGAATGEWVWP